MTPPADPLRQASLYEAARRRAQRHLEIATAWENRIALGRLAILVALLAILSSIWPFFGPSARMGALATALLLALIVVLVHLRFRRRRDRWQSLAVSYEQSCWRYARNFGEIEKRRNPWSQQAAAPTGHPYAHDLDIVSRIFPLFDTCSTPAGSQALLENLLKVGVTPPSEEVRRLRGRRALQFSKLPALLRRLEGLRLSEENRAEAIRDQSTEGAAPASPKLDSAARKQAFLAAFLGIGAWFAIALPAFIRFLQVGDGERFLRTLFLYALIPLAGTLIFRPVTSGADGILRTARALRLLLKHLTLIADHEDFRGLSCFHDDARRTLQRLALAVDLISVRNNPVLWLILHALLPWDSLACLFLLLLVRKTGDRLEIWRGELAEIDFLSALGRFAHENPHCRIISDSTPASDATLLAMEEAGHPLVMPAALVTNTVRIERASPLILLTGSNMSGKSTFLRTVGTNLVLHAMGAPVCAKSLESPLRQVLCAIRVDDSLADGTSYFYAEVKRLRFILDSLRTGHERGRDCLFLVDEIFRGTNNRERLIGSAAVLEALLEAGHPGLVSTHDLALTKLEESDPRLRNFHFREHIEEGRLVFDYTLRNGPCPTTNALRIMRDSGLPVPLPDEAAAP